MHGVELVRVVIEKLEHEGFGDDPPVGVPADALEGLRFPNGTELSASLKTWLAFDASFLGWFDDPQKPVFAGTKFDSWTLDEYGMDWGFGALTKRLPGDCYPVPLGTDSRRCLYIGEHRDSIGEPPVLVIDVDDLPYAGVEYPGIDVYVAHAFGVVSEPEQVYGAYRKHKVYGARMQEHADALFGGKVGLEIYEF